MFIIRYGGARQATFISLSYVDAYILSPPCLFDAFPPRKFDTVEEAKRFLKDNNLPLDLYFVEPYADCTQREKQKTGTAPLKKPLFRFR